VIAYLDASVILRLILGQPDKLAEWLTITTGVCSALAEVECLRTLDRLRVERALSEATIKPRRDAVLQLLQSAVVVSVTQTVLERAAQPLPSTLGTLDAIHLATASLWQESLNEPLVMATHDKALARAARAVGFEVVGVANESLS
jgi:uncharacterized protein